MSTPIADVVVVAAGRSTRMDGLEKLTAPIGGRPMLSWTLGALARMAPIERIVVAVAAERVREMAAAAWLPKGVTVLAGGERRQESVAAGISWIESEGAAADRIVLVHTEVLPDAEGMGVGSRLARGALDDARARGLKVSVICPFITAYLRRHPGEYEDLVGV